MWSLIVMALVVPGSLSFKIIPYIEPKVETRGYI